MKRGANGDIFLKMLERMRKTIPGVAIRTSMIAGATRRLRICREPFPQERKEAAEAVDPSFGKR